MLSTRMLLLPRSRTLSKLNIERCAVEAIIETPNGPLRNYSFHLDHVSPDERISQIEYLKERLNSFARENGSLTGGAEVGLTDPPWPKTMLSSATSTWSRNTAPASA